MTIAHEIGSVAERQLRQACAELDRSLRLGRPDRAERHFGAHPLLAAHAQSAVELIYAEFVTREELGQRPTPEEYYLRFPRWKEALRRQFSIHEWMRGGCPDDPSAPAPGEEDEPTPGVPCCPWTVRVDRGDRPRQRRRGVPGLAARVGAHRRDQVPVPRGRLTGRPRAVPARSPGHGPAAPPEHHARLRRGGATRRRLFQHAVRRPRRCPPGRPARGPPPNRRRRPSCAGSRRWPAPSTTPTATASSTATSSPATFSSTTTTARW